MDPSTFSQAPIKPKRFAKLSDYLNWIKTHKKATFVVVSLVFLFVIIFSIIFQVFKNKFSLFSPPQQTQIPDGSANEPAFTTGSLRIVADKDVYAVGEIVTMRVYADSKGKVIRGYDVQIKFDAEFLSLTDKVTPSLTQFELFVINDKDYFTVSGMQKESISEDLFFNNAALFKYQFTAKKAGKTQINIIQSTNFMNESNLLDKESHDLLSHVYGKDIEIR